MPLYLPLCLQYSLTAAHLSLFPVKAVGVILIHLRHQVLGTPAVQYIMST
jgi:hypothetical protein